MNLKDVRAAREEKRRQRRKKGKSIFWIIVILLVCVAGGFFYASYNNKKASVPKVPDVSSGDLDLRSQSKEAQRMLDTILMTKNDWQLSDNGRIDKKEKRADAKGDILWTQRKLSVGIAQNEDLETAAAWLKGKAKANNIAIIDSKLVGQGQEKTFELELGVYGKAGTQDVKCVTDKVTIFKGEKPAEKTDTKKDIPKLGGKLVVIVDDCGYDLAPLRKLLSLPVAMTFAVLPDVDNTSDAFDMINASGKEAMLHLPMEPMDASAASTDQLVTVDMTKEQVMAFTKKKLDLLPGIVGVNNHQGSRATSNKFTMKAVLEVIKSRGLFFIDSNTIAGSVGDSIAREMGVATGRNKLFLDNSADTEDIKAMIWKAAKLADQNGPMIVICHARPATAQAWSEVYADVKASGTQFLTASDIVN